jgi:hypothetical protein
MATTTTSLTYNCDCGNAVLMDQEYLTYINWKDKDAYPEPQCAQCLCILTYKK